LKRNTATIAMAQGVLINLQPQQPSLSCASKSVGNWHGMGNVAVLRINTSIGISRLDHAGTNHG
jgi:hypothetical protein